MEVQAHGIGWETPLAAREALSVSQRRGGEKMYGGMSMYAVIRAGGKQYRVAPGDVVKIEKTSSRRPEH